MKKKYTTEELYAALEECKQSSFDGKNRCVSDSNDIEADGELWALVSDHGNAEIGYRGRNGRIYWIGGIV